MSMHKERAEKREANEPPKNFTCGSCGKVHPYNEGYECTDEEQAEVE